MKIEHIFTTPLATDYLDVDNEALEKYCYNEVEKTKARISWAYKNQSTFIDLTDPVIQPLLALVEDRFNKYYTSLGFKSDHKLKILQAWANTNNSHPIDIPHCHPQSMFAGVYYVKGTGTRDNGNLNLMSPVDAIKHYVEGNNIAQSNGFNAWGWEITPETGKLVLFPSWTMHCVSQNQLTEPRISIAFDAVMDNSFKLNPLNQK